MSGLKKPLEYTVTGLSINQDIGAALVTVTDIDRQTFLRNTIQKLAKEKKDPYLDFKISNPETKDIIIIIHFKRDLQLIVPQ